MENNVLAELEEFLRTKSHLIFGPSVNMDSLEKAFGCYSRIVYHLEEKGEAGIKEALKAYFFFLYNILERLDASEKDSYDAYDEVTKEIIYFISRRFEDYGMRKEILEMNLSVLPYEFSFRFFHPYMEPRFLKSCTWRLEEDRDFESAERYRLTALLLHFFICREKNLFNVYDKKELQRLFEAALNSYKERSRTKEAIAVIELWLDMCDEINGAKPAEEGYGLFGYRVAYEQLAQMYDGTPRHLLSILEKNNSRFLSDPYIMVCKNGFYGFIDRSGKEILPCSFQGARRAVSKNLLAVKNQNGYWEVVTPNGAKMVYGCYKYISISTDDTIMLYDDKDNVSFRKGGQIMNCPYKALGFRGFIDGTQFGLCLDIEHLLSGDDSLKEKYNYEEFRKYIGNRVDNIYDTVKKRIVFPNDALDYTPSKGVYIVTQFDFEKIPSQSCVWSVLDREGRILVPPGKYDKISPYSEEGFSLVERNGLFGYIDTVGEEVIPLRYPEARSFSNGYAAVFRADKGWGYIDCSGKESIPCRFLSAGDFQDGLATVRLGKNKKNHSVGTHNYTYIDTKGRILKNRFQFASWFFKKTSYVVIGNKLRRIDNEKHISDIV